MNNFLDMDKLKEDLNKAKRKEIEDRGGVVFCVGDAVTPELEQSVFECSVVLASLNIEDVEREKVMRQITDTVNIALETAARYGLKIGALAVQKRIEQGGEDEDE